MSDLPVDLGLTGAVERREGREDGVSLERRRVVHGPSRVTHYRPLTEDLYHRTSNR